MTDIDAIKKALAATPAAPTRGQWRSISLTSGYGIYDDAGSRIGGALRPADAAFIAACSPDVIAALVAEVEALRASNAQFREALTDCVDDSRAAVEAHVAAYGERYRPERLAYMRRCVERADALLASESAGLATRSTAGSETPAAGG